MAAIVHRRRRPKLGQRATLDGAEIGFNQRAMTNKRDTLALMRSINLVYRRDGATLQIMKALSTCNSE
jgi:hypothetical protein